MAEIDRVRIQSLYSELKGYLESLPSPKGFNGPNRIGRRFNVICDELSSIARTSFSHLKLDDDEDHNGYGFDGATLKSSIAGLVSRLESDYGFADIHKTNSQPAIVINNQNSNAIDININFTLETLIDTAETEEEKAQLESLDEELKKPNANWDKIKSSLSWILNYSKDLSLKVLPIVLDHYLMK
jgi:hypothetical protein